MSVVKSFTRLDAPALDANDVELRFVERDVNRALVVPVAVDAEIAYRLVLPRSKDEKASLTDSWEIFFALKFDRLKLIF